MKFNDFISFKFDPLPVLWPLADHSLFRSGLINHTIDHLSSFSKTKLIIRLSFCSRGAVANCTLDKLTAALSRRAERALWRISA